MAPTQWLDEQIRAVFFSPTLLLFLFCFIIVVFKLAIKNKNKPNLNLPPSPPKLPIIGNLHQIGTLPYRSFRALSQKYGAMMLLQLGQIPTIVVSSADVAKEIMKTHDIAFSNRPQLTAAKILVYGCNDIGFASYGEAWRQKRKIFLLQLLNPKRVQRSFNLIREEEVATLVNKIHEACSSDACSVNISEMLTETVYKFIGKCALGQHNTEDFYKRVGELAKKVMIQVSVVTVGDHFPLLSWVDILTGQIQEFKATFEALDGLFDQVIAEHKKLKREANHDSNEQDSVDILIQLQEGGMLDFEPTKDDIKSLLLNMITAGSDTTSATVEWAIAELMKNPIILKKSQEEVRRVVGHKSKVEENDISQMDYLKCVVKETLRLHPAAPLLIPKETSCSVKLKGYDIPAKTMVYVNAWAIHRDPEFWERPEEFIPERHDKSNVFKVQDLNLIPFGFGRRVCPGMAFGLAAVEYVLANLLYRFDWKLPAADNYEQGIDMSETYGLVPAKKVPLHLKPIAFSFQSKI